MIILLDPLNLVITKKQIADKTFPELQQLPPPNASFQQLENFFKKIAEAKGAEYAYALLDIAPLPPNTDLHLLGHVVGDELYKQQGAGGIKTCTQNFRNACSHSIVVGLFFDKGKEALPEIVEACKQAPGGKGAYPMCFHGLGHGILAYNGYDIAQTVAMCQLTGSNREFPECVGGMIMEIVGGGGHDQAKWQVKRTEYLKPQDPVSLCRGNLIPAIAKNICYVYITPFLFEAASGSLHDTSEATFAKAFKYCINVTKNDLNQESCYNGFAKEFVVLANARDIRTVDQMTQANMEKIISWCNLAISFEPILTCITHSINSFYWGGENDYKASVKFCSITGPKYQSGCFNQIITLVGNYKSDSNYKNSFCSSLPSDFQQNCRSKLHI